MTEAYVVTGRSDSGEIHPRLEIRDLAKNAEQWTLFVFALTFLQNPNILLTNSTFNVSPFPEVKLPADFLNIGGIHGLPYERWAGDPPGGRQYSSSENSGATKNTSTSARGKDDKSNDSAQQYQRFGGYCNHSSVLFPPWHRPFVMAIEQSVGEIATALVKSIAQAYPNESTKWTTAAKQLRFPFWDWTLDETLPTLLTERKISILMPGPTHVEVDNPLFSFEFGTARPDGFDNTTMQIPETDVQVTAYYKDWQRTCRWPQSQKNANDDYKTLNQKLHDHHGDLVRSVGHLFCFPPKSDSPASMWDEFSNTAFQSGEEKAYNAKAIEGPHNSIHLYTGGIGHMGNPDYAGFDPLFYLHHANVDRIYALWEYVYPSYWMGLGYKDKEGNAKFFRQPGGTTSTLENSRVDEMSDLLPFRKKINEYWTASDARSLLRDSPTPKWYTYPAIEGIQVDKPVKNPAQLEIYRRKLQKHFGISVEPLGGEHLPNLFTEAPRVKTPDGDVLIKKYRHIIISVALLEHALGHSYSLEIEYEATPGAVQYGHVAVFARALETRCASCIARRDADNVVHGIINIPAPDLNGLFSGFNPGSGTQTLQAELHYLKTSLTARLRTCGGNVYATAKYNTNVAEGCGLNRRIVPKLGLHTAFACRPEGGNDAETPVEFFGWEDHGELFADKWEKT